MKPLGLPLKTWGGPRKGAGRPPNGPQAGVSHLARTRFPERHPVHVTLRTAPGVGNLRGSRRYQAILTALREAKERGGLRVIHFSVQGNQLDLLVEADGAGSLSRGVQGLSVRLARALNRAGKRRGKVFLDRYHAQVLASRREVARALRSILENFRQHLREDVAPRGGDPCSSAAWLTGPLPDDAPVVRPRTWLARHARDG